jgi:integrase/recombinase XerC
MMLNITIAQATERFLASLRPRRRPSTLLAYRNALETFSNMLASQQLDVSTSSVAELREDSIAQFITYMQKLSPTTESLYLQVIKNFFEFLYAENLAPINVSRVRTLMRNRTRRLKTQPPEYPEVDIKRVIAVMSNIRNGSALKSDQTPSILIRDMRDSALILTLADTGLRTEEISKLKIGDIDWTGNRATLNGQGHKQSFARFSSRAINALRDYLDLRMTLDAKTGQHSSTLPLFARHDKGTGQKIQALTPTTIRNIVADRVNEILGPEAAGTITPHTFVHYFVTSILRATGNLKLAQVLARHANIQITQKYAHLSDEELDKGYYEIFEKREGS